jgi:hypothetical protein
MNNQAPIKSVLVSGNLNSSVKYKLCPPTEFREGVWNLCLSSIAFNCKTQYVKEICAISCNFVNGHRYNKNNEVELYEESLALTLIESKTKTQYFG